MPIELCAFITLDENFKSLSNIDNTFQNSNVIVKKFIENCRQLTRTFKKNTRWPISIFILHFFQNIEHKITNLLSEIK